MIRMIDVFQNSLSCSLPKPGSLYNISRIKFILADFLCLNEKLEWMLADLPLHLAAIVSLVGSLVSLE